VLECVSFAGIWFKNVALIYSHELYKSPRAETGHDTQIFYAGLRSVEQKPELPEGRIASLYEASIRGWYFIIPYRTKRSSSAPVTRDPAYVNLLTGKNLLK
jgi:hypothetical protein